MKRSDMEQILRELASLREAAAEVRETTKRLEAEALSRVRREYAEEFDRANSLALEVSTLEEKVRAAAEAIFRLNHEKQPAAGLSIHVAAAYNYALDEAFRMTGSRPAFVTIEKKITPTIATDLRKFYPKEEEL